MSDVRYGKAWVKGFHDNWRLFSHFFVAPVLSPTWLSSLFAPAHKASSNPDFPNISIVGFPSLSGQITKLVLADLQFGSGHLVSDGLGTVPAEVNLL